MSFPMFQESPWQRPQRTHRHGDLCVKSTVLKSLVFFCIGFPMILFFLFLKNCGKIMTVGKETPLGNKGLNSHGFPSSHVLM